MHHLGICPSSVGAVVDLKESSEQPPLHLPNHPCRLSGLLHYSKLSRLPKRKCCMMGTLESTSTWYIFIIPLFTCTATVHQMSAYPSASSGERPSSRAEISYYTGATFAHTDQYATGVVQWCLFSFPCLLTPAISSNRWVSKEVAAPCATLAAQSLLLCGCGRLW